MHDFRETSLGRGAGIGLFNLQCGVSVGAGSV